jgi:hypothetical protein
MTAPGVVPVYDVCASCGIGTITRKGTLSMKAYGSLCNAFCRCTTNCPGGGSTEDVNGPVVAVAEGCESGMLLEMKPLQKYHMMDPHSCMVEVPPTEQKDEVQKGRQSESWP